MTRALTPAAQAAVSKRLPRFNSQRDYPDMSKLSILVLALLLSGCGPEFMARVHDVHVCTDAAGPKPMPLADAFGLLGVLAAHDARADYYASIDGCMARAREARL
jgi:hypothetical protein